jgi:hypothetical protein
VAIPPLGSGNGGLDWEKVKNMMLESLSELDCEIFLYEPNAEIKEALKKERVKLTPARAMLLAVLYDLVRNGEFVSEFTSEKVAYFLQRFGAQDQFKLEYRPYFYGPYSGKVRHVLHYLNGSYLTGYNDKDKKPFEELSLVMDAEQDVLNYLQKEEHKPYLAIVENTKRFLAGFYSNFNLELLSSVDFIANQKNTFSEEVVREEMSQWSTRKKTLFSNPKFLSISLQKVAAIT